MVMAANFFKLDSVDSDTDEETTTASKVAAESQGTLADRNSIKKKKKKKESDEKSDCDDGGKKSKKKKKVSGVEANRSHEKALVNTDDDAKRKRKRVDDTDLGDTVHKSNSKKKKKTSVNSFSSENNSKKKSKEKILRQDPETQTENPEKSTKDPKTKRKKKKQSSDPDNKDPDADKTQTEAEENHLNSPENGKKKKKKKNPEAQENNNNNRKEKRKKKQSSDPDNKDPTEDADKTQTEAEENDLNSPEKCKKKKKNPEAEENKNNKGKEKRKKKKKKQKGSKSDEVVTTPPSKSAKKVNFSDHVEVFPAESEESDYEEEEDDEKVDLVRGKRFTEEEDELIKKSVLEYVDNHALGDEGVNMVMNCKAHKQIKGCWKEIAAALPWRPYTGVYYRAHTLFEEGSKGVWTKEDFELVVEYQKKHGNEWKTLADAMGKHRVHVKDAWRRIRLAAKKRGHWSMQEYQTLFDLVNKDLRMKAFKEKHSKHGMLRDNIPWMAISDQLGTRDHTLCCEKWYDQLTSPMVAKGIWANVDDYMLLDELANLDAACVDDVDWDNLLDNRDGDACRSRWNQMVRHIGIPGTKTFAEQVEILSQRYCPDIAEDREDFDNRPFDPED